MRKRSQSTKNKHTHKTRKPQTRILYPAKLSFKNEGEIKIFPDKPKTKRICCQQTCFARNIKSSLSWKQVKPTNTNIYKEKKCSSKGNYVIIKDSVSVYFFSLDLKSNFINKQ